MIGRRFGRLTIRGESCSISTFACECDCGLWIMQTRKRLESGAQVECSRCAIATMHRIREALRAALPRRDHAAQSRATSAVADAIRAGVLTRPARCSTCDEEHARIQAHHDDYGKPLDVRWLCAPCHVAHHAKQRRAIKRAAREAVSS
jgi:hypothetical protein